MKHNEKELEKGAMEGRRRDMRAMDLSPRDMDPSYRYLGQELCLDPNDLVETMMVLSQTRTKDSQVSLFPIGGRD